MAYSDMFDSSALDGGHQLKQFERLGYADQEAFLASLTLGYDLYASINKAERLGEIDSVDYIRIIEGFAGRTLYVLPEELHSMVIDEDLSAGGSERKLRPNLTKRKKEEIGQNLSYFLSQVFYSLATSEIQLGDESEENKWDSNDYHFYLMRKYFTSHTTISSGYTGEMSLAEQMMYKSKREYSRTVALAAIYTLGMALAHFDSINVLDLYGFDINEEVIEQYRDIFTNQIIALL